MDASLQPLLDLTSTVEFEEFGWLTIQSAVWPEEEDLLSLHLVLHQRDHRDERWIIQCQQVRNSLIRNHQAVANLAVETVHPLLLPHVSPVVELYFQGRPSSADLVVGQLLEAHRGVVGDWFGCMHFFNVGPDYSLRRMLEGGFGKLAAGPQPLIQAYAQTLRANDVLVSWPPLRPPVWWDGQRWVEEVTPLFALILGESYVVAPAVTAKRE